MTGNTAYKILGLASGSDKKTIKKRYRYLMHHVHPDTGAFKVADSKIADYAYSAQEINEAYAFLCKNNRINTQAVATDTSDVNKNKYNTNQRTENTKGNSSDKTTRQNHSYDNFDDFNKSANFNKHYKHWNAETNMGAYTERNIYHYAEDSSGNVFGAFVIATGKYIWNHNEDFPLFLKSMFDVSKRLIDNIEEKRTYPASDNIRLKFQAELTYLLSQQFIHLSSAMHSLLKPVSDKTTDIFYIDSMLELCKTPPVLRAGMTLYPAYLKKHRLFVKTKAGKEAGYISFKDDRLYYIIIPLLEQKRAKVKIEISKNQDRLNTKGINKYKNIDFMIKLLLESDKSFPENINIKIDELLNTFLKT